MLRSSQYILVEETREITLVGEIDPLKTALIKQQFQQKTGVWISQR